MAIFSAGPSAPYTPVDVTINANELGISAANAVSLRWSATGLRLVGRRRFGKAVTFLHVNHPGARLTVSEPALLHAIDVGNPELFGKSGSGMPAARYTVLLLAAIGAFGWLVISVVPGIVGHFLPNSLRTEIGRKLEEAMAQGARECKTLLSDRALTYLMSRFAEGNIDLPPVGIKIHDMALMNAFTFPGGRIMITRQLIAQADNADQFAGVLAHELGHAANFHPEAQLVRLLGVNVLSSASGSASNATSTAFLAAMLKQSRNNEEEADAYARSLLVAAHIDPIGLKFFLQKLLKREVSAKSGVAASDSLNDMFSTHPATQDRIDKIRPLPIDVKTSPAMTDEDWQALKQACG